MNLLFFGLAAIGMTHIVVDGSIFDPVRRLLKRLLPAGVYKVFECHQCSGFWCGMILGFLLIGHEWYNVFAAGCASSFLSHLAANYIEYLQANATVIPLPPEKDENG